MEPSDFVHQEVRDLAWVMTAPSLLDRAGSWPGPQVDDDWCRRVYAEGLDWLADLDVDPTRLRRQLQGSGDPAAPGFRLGHYVEQLLACWLRGPIGATDVHCTVPVRDGRRVLGEFDLLWRDRRGPPRHWEVAWKYQLLPVDATGELDDWLGLHPADRLAVKLRHLFTVQLELGATPAGRTLLQQRFATTELTAAAMVKGHCFVPAASWPAARVPTVGLSPDLPLGWWCHRRQVPEALPDPGLGSRWIIVPRRAWIGPAVRVPGEPGILARGEVADALRRCPAQPQLLAALRRDLRGRWVECCRGFVLTDDWQPGRWRGAGP